MIYIHVPFCHRKCTYCAFYSKPVAGGRWSVAGYVDALIEEMRERRGEQAHPIRTVYFGGGTPSILPLSELGRIVDSLRECFDLSQVEEVTLEANPEDLTADYLKGLKALNFVNRLSIGIQSLDDEMLRLIGRRHTAAQALAAVEESYSAGFHNLSVDFIYGLPKDFQFSSLDSLSSSGSCRPSRRHTTVPFQGSVFDFQKVSHISAYALTVEPGTAMAVQVEQGRVVLPDEDEVVRQYHALHRLFAEAGLRQYEVSNYARPGFESKHNSRYWDRTPYLGLGPGAHSFMLCDAGSTLVEKRRWNNPDGTFEQETLTAADAYNELLMTSLRTVRGLPLSRVPENQRERLLRGVQPYIDCGWMVLKDNSLVPTEEGLLHADGMAAALFLA